MTDLRFRDKRGGSLARRVLILAFAFLVFPLLIYTLWLFQQDISFLENLPGEGAFKISKEKFFTHLSLLFLLILIVGGALTWWLTKRMARPLKGLAKAMARVGEGHLSSRYEKDFLGFEINFLGASFNEMVENLSGFLEQVRREKLAKEILLNELKIGHEIQKQIFPKEIPAIPGMQIAWKFFPAFGVSGDFYDIFPRPDSQAIVLVLGDAAGKGISACLFALLLRSFLRAGFYYGEKKLAHIVQSTNALFSRDTQGSGDFSTAWIGELDLKTKTLEYISCGHLPALLMRQNGKIEELSSGHIALGVEEKIELASVRCSLFTGDLLIIYSDGIVEAHDPQQQFFGRERLEQAIRQVKDRDVEHISAHILDKVKQFSAGAPLHDDLTLLTIKVT